MTLSYLLLEFKKYENCQGQLFMFCLSVVVVPKEILNVLHLRTEGKHSVILYSSTNLLTSREQNVDTVTNLEIRADKKPSINKSGIIINS
jgi:hypothetical protein